MSVLKCAPLAGCMALESAPVGDCQASPTDPSLPSGGTLKEKAFASFTAFLGIVEVCQREGSLPAGDPIRLAGLIYATVHGAIDLEIGGRANGEKGLANVTDTLDLLLRLLAA